MAHRHLSGPLLLTLLASGLVSVAGVAGLGGGMFMVALDLRTRTDDFDGLGVLFGAVLSGLGVLLLGVAGLAVWLAHRHPFRAGVVLCVFGSLVAGLGVLALQTFGVVLAVPLVLGGLLVGGIGFGAAVGASAKPVGSAGGYPQ